MNILLTGSSGFLGKYVLRQLLKKDEVGKIYLTTRKNVQFPKEYSDKIHLIQCDLSDPASYEHLEKECTETIDAVIHLAGNYNFSRYSDDFNENENYVGNVVPLLHLLAFVRKWNCPIFFASSYVTQLLPEDEVTKSLPSQHFSYQDTKRICEDLLMKSGCYGSVFRLGILVGDSKTGYIEKTDGPYAFMNLLLRLKRFGYQGLVPVFTDSDSVLPLVPVDEAALCITDQVLHTFYGKNKGLGTSKDLQFFSIFRTDDLSVVRFTTWACSQLSPQVRPSFVDWNADVLSRFQERFTDVPSESLRMARMKFRSNMDQTLPLNRQISLFDDYKAALLSGFLEFNGHETGSLVYQT